MRTSSQLRKSDSCEFNPNASITQSSEALNLAVAQKSVIRRMLMGEPITDVRGELANTLDARGHIWENINQKEAWLSTASRRIVRFTDWERNRSNGNIRFANQLTEAGPIAVDYFGEQVEVKPDYVTEDEENIYMCKIKTGRYNPSLASEALKSPEAYCFGLAGEKLAEGTNKKVVIQYLYLGEKTDAYEKMAFSAVGDGRVNYPYDDSSDNLNKIAEEYFDEPRKEAIREEIQKTKQENEHTGCSPEDCAGCAMNNICHFEEPPIPAPASEAVRPAGEVRLSNDQRNVVNYDRGIARVNAGPGSGKTLVVSLRVAELVKNGADPEKICLLTFTNAGAGEMTARAVAYSAAAGVPVDPDKFTSSTFNAFCQDIICAPQHNNPDKFNYELLGFDRMPRVVPGETQRSIINRILDQFPKISAWSYSSAAQKIYRRSTSKVAFVRATDDFALIKKEGYTRDNYPPAWNSMYTPNDLDYLFMMCDEYNIQMKERGFLEFDDQLLYVNQLLQINPHLFEEMGYEHIIVDEFQDTDLPQIQLLQKMIDIPQFKSLMCVRDDSQSIFAFRHTSPEYMVNFGSYFGRFDDFSLVENHRSNRRTIDYANKVNDLARVKVNKELIATKPEGNMPGVQGFYSEKQEYEWIAKQVKERWDAGNHDIAVIMSDRFELSGVADALTKLGVPSTLKSPILVTQNSRVCALTTFYDAFMGRSTQGFLDYRNVVSGGALRGKNGGELEEIAESFREDVMQCEKTKESFMEFAKALDLEEHDECYQDFLSKIDGCKDLDEICEFMEDFKIYGKDSTFKREGRYDGVCLTTIHSSKGLEWDTTFLCVDKLDDQKYHDRPTTYQANGEYDEQIRKWFVGATRAREELVVTGKYIVHEINDQKNGVFSRTYNEFLKGTYQMLGKAWDYNYAEDERVRAAEKADRIKDAAKESNLPTFGRNSEKEGSNRISGNVARAIVRNVLDQRDSGERTP